MTSYLLLLFLSILNTVCWQSTETFAKINIEQSRFEGPVDIKVWKHWQGAWNVEQTKQKFTYRLIRGHEAEGSAAVRLV